MTTPRESSLRAEELSENQIRVSAILRQPYADFSNLQKEKYDEEVRYMDRHPETAIIILKNAKIDLPEYLSVIEKEIIKNKPAKKTNDDFNGEALAEGVSEKISRGNEVKPISYFLDQEKRVKEISNYFGEQENVDCVKYEVGKTLFVKIYGKNITKESLQNKTYKGFAVIDDPRNEKITQYLIGQTLEETLTKPTEKIVVSSDLEFELEENSDEEADYENKLGCATEDLYERGGISESIVERLYDNLDIIPVEVMERYTKKFKKTGMKGVMQKMSDEEYLDRIGIEKEDQIYALHRV